MAEARTLVVSKIATDVTKESIEARDGVEKVSILKTARHMDSEQDAAIIFESGDAANQFAANASVENNWESRRYQPAKDFERHGIALDFTKPAGCVVQ